MPADDRDIRRPKPPPPSVRAQTAPPVDAVPEGDFDDCTGKYEGEELAAARAKRPTDKRLAKLEAKHDDLGETVTKIRVDVGEIKGSLTGQDRVLEDIRAALRGVDARDHITFRAQVDVDTAMAKAQISDGLDARKIRRKLVSKLIGAAIALMSSGAVIHWLLSRL